MQTWMWPSPRTTQRQKTLVVKNVQNICVPNRARFIVDFARAKDVDVCRRRTLSHMAVCTAPLPIGEPVSGMVVGFFCKGHQRLKRLEGRESCHHGMSDQQPIGVMFCPTAASGMNMSGFWEQCPQCSGILRNHFWDTVA